MSGTSLWDGKRLGVIGGGNMAEALVRGVTRAGLIAPERICVYDINAARREVFASIGCGTAERPEDAVKADAVLLATKPQTVRDAVKGFDDGDAAGLVVSILAGVTTATLESLLPDGARVVRVMPNTPLLVGKGMAGLAGGRNARGEDVELALALFSCSGDAVRVDEKDLDAVTALSGSGPAYVFHFAEALIAGGAELGLSPELAKRLAIGTLAGAAEMLQRDGDAAKLRERVTSPGGTTAAALDVFYERDFRGIVAAAMKAACRRGAELGKG